jgi:ATP-dependent DNA helicase 2 subunit 2
VQPDKPVAPPAEILIKWSKPPEELVKKAAPSLEKLIQAADVKVVEKKAKGKRYGREQITPLSGLDLDALLTSEKPRKITIENSIPDFKHLLNHTTSESMVLDAADQMVKIIYKMVMQVENPFPPERIVENIRVLRTELLEHEVPAFYNDFARDFKQKLVKGEFAIDKRILWFQLKKGRVGLIDNEALEKSDVSKEEAEEVSICPSGETRMLILRSFGWRTEICQLAPNETRGHIT